jgi:hypothetical protein
MIEEATHARRGAPRVVLGSSAAAIEREAPVQFLSIALPHDGSS